MRKVRIQVLECRLTLCCYKKIAFVKFSKQQRTGKWSFYSWKTSNKSMPGKQTWILSKEMPLEGLFMHMEEYPTKKRLLVSLRKVELFSGCQRSLSLLLQRLGFRWNIFFGNSTKLLLERQDFVPYDSCGNFEHSDWWCGVFEWNMWMRGIQGLPFGLMCHQKESKLILGKGTRLILLHAGTVESVIYMIQICYYH